MDQLSASPASPHPSMPAKRRDLPSRKRPVPPPVEQPVSAPSTSGSGAQPLFLPESDEEQAPSLSVKTSLFPPPGGEGVRPQRKKRRISYKASQSRPLETFWQSRQVSAISFDL